MNGYITYKPSFEYRVGSYGELWNGVEFTKKECVCIEMMIYGWDYLQTRGVIHQVKNAYHFDALN